MVLLMKGHGIQRPDWHVDEPVAAGYSRLYLIEHGEVSYHESGGNRLLLPGRIYLFPPSVPYSMRHNPELPLDCLWMHVDFFPIYFSTLLELSPESDSQLSCFWELLRNQFSTENQQSNSAQYAILSFLYYLQERYLPQESSAIGAAAQYIRRSFRESSLSIQAISSHFGYTPEHFIRTFTRTMGMTPYQYLLHIRMYEARRLLLENHTVIQTAQMVGYENPRAFSRAFFRKYGILPGEFRKNLSPFAGQIDA